MSLASTHDSRYYLTVDERRENQGDPEDLDRDKPVPSEPMPEKGGEDELHGEGHHRPGRRWTKVCDQNAPTDATRHVAVRAIQTSPGGRTMASKRGQEDPEEREVECHREHLGECEPGGVVPHGVTGEESYMQDQGERRRVRNARSRSSCRVPILEMLVYVGMQERV